MIKVQHIGLSGILLPLFYVLLNAKQVRSKKAYKLQALWLFFRF